MTKQNFPDVNCRTISIIDLDWDCPAPSRMSNSLAVLVIVWPSRAKTGPAVQIIYRSVSVIIIMGFLFFSPHRCLCPPVQPGVLQEQPGGGVAVHLHGRPLGGGASVGPDG